MATFVANGLLRAVADFQSGQWSWGDIANGYRSGHGNINSCRKIHQFNWIDYQVSNRNRKYALGSLCMSTWKIFKTTLKAHRLAPAVPLMDNHRTLLKGIACGWAGINLISMFGDKPVTVKKLTAKNTTLWDATPFLLFIVNLALTTLELRTNPRKVLVSYATLALCVADSYKYLPSQVSYVMNTILPLPMRAVSIYYADSNWKRAALIGEGIISVFSKLQ
jgi:hypothetical protein